MKQPLRFKDYPAPSRAGRLLDLGSQERPAAEALHRVAQGLGISAAGMAAAAASTVAAPSAAAAVAAASGATGGGLTALTGKAASSFWVASIIKGTLIGVGLTVVTYTSLQWVDSGPQSNTPSSTSAPLHSSRLPQRGANDTAASLAPALLQTRDPAPVEAQRPAAATAGTAGTNSATGPPESVTAPAANAAATARFADTEPTSVALHQLPEATRSIGNAAPVAAAAGVPSTRNLPADARLAREVTSLDQARTLAARGDAVAALREIDAFNRSTGYVALRKEAMLVNIDVLISLGRSGAAANIARQLLALGAPATQRAKLEALIRNQP